MRALHGMVEGEWSRADEQPPTSSAPHSAVLPAQGAELARDTEVMCLDLVQVSTVSPAGDWAWAVLSEAAVDTYAHAAGLRRGERWFFVAGDERRGRAVHEARFAAPIARDQIAPRYGTEAASRARRDRPAMQLVLRRVDTAPPAKDP
jgi:hypothetical protein